MHWNWPPSAVLATDLILFGGIGVRLKMPKA